MHIPDGFISPKVYIPLYIVSAGLWSVGFYKLRKELNEETLPLIATLTALSFILMSIAIPIPGGTSIHGTGVALLSILISPWISFIASSLVLLMQALLFGEGGITTLPVNAIAISFIGSFSAYFSFKILRRLNEKFALIFAGFISLVLPAFFIAIILGIQLYIAHDESGKPLFFPFGIEITIPAIVIPHLFAGIGEGLFTMFIYSFIKKIKNVKR